MPCSTAILCVFAEELADWLCAEHGHPAVRSVLEALRGGMEGQSWFDKLGTLQVPVKLAILQRVAPLHSSPAHLMVAHLHAAKLGHTQQLSQYVRLASWDALLLCIVHNCACSGCLKVVENSAVWPLCRCAAVGCGGLRGQPCARCQ